MRTILGVLLLLVSSMNAWGGHLHDDAERDHRSRAARLATGRLTARTNRARAPWPVAVLSIGHTIASYQNYGSDPYFHHGLDIRADAGSDVFASVGGKVVNIENYVPGSPADWEVAILDDEGFLWQYHHVDRQSIPQAILDAYKTGAKISAGTKIGEVYYWEVVTFGERFHHIHLNVLGEGQAYVSPFAFLEPLGDTSAPEVKAIKILKDGRPVDGRRVTGNYSLTAEVSDLIRHTKFTVPPHAITYEVDGGMPVVVWQFDRLPGGSSNTQYVHDFFVRPDTCGNYSCRKAVVNLAFRKGESGQVFPTTPGKHHIRVRVRDFEGNAAEKEFEWTVE
jgi:hypothetical protein